MLMTVICAKAPPLKNKTKAIRKAVRKEAQKTGFAHVGESDTVYGLGLSLEQLWIRLQPLFSVGKQYFPMENSITQLTGSHKSG